MKILHILTDGPRNDAAQIIATHVKQHEVEVVDLSMDNFSYTDLVDKIEQNDRVISW